MKSKGKGKGRLKNRSVNLASRTPNYDRYHRFSDSNLGRYSRYPGIFLMILLLIGLLAGITPAGNAFIDFNNLAGQSAGAVWLVLSMTAGMLALGLYALEDHYERKANKGRYIYGI